MQFLSIGATPSTLQMGHNSGRVFHNCTVSFELLEETEVSTLVMFLLGGKEEERQKAMMQTVTIPIDSEQYRAAGSAQSRHPSLPSSCF